LQKRRILVTGASGLLGINLALEAAKRHTVYGLVNANPLQTNAFHVLHGDLLVPGAAQRLIDEVQPDWVIHCAALANLEACESAPGRARQLNTGVPQILASYVARGGARLLHVSTDAVFDGQRGDYTELDSPNPLSVYAKTKLDAERAIAETNPDAIIARVNLFGWSPSGKRSLAEFFYNNLSAKNPIMGFTDVFFCPLLANHLARIFLEMLDAELSGLYHVVSREAISKYNFGAAIAGRFGLDSGLISPVSINQAGLKAARSPNLTLSINKLIHDLGEHIHNIGGEIPNLSAGLERFYTLYQQGYPQRLRELGNYVIGQ